MPAPDKGTTVPGSSPRSKIRTAISFEPGSRTPNLSPPQSSQIQNRTLDQQVWRFAWAFFTFVPTGSRRSHQEQMAVPNLGWIRTISAGLGQPTYSRRGKTERIRVREERTVTLFSPPSSRRVLKTAIRRSRILFPTQSEYESRHSRNSCLFSAVNPAAMGFHPVIHSAQNFKGTSSLGL